MTCGKKMERCFMNGKSCAYEQNIRSLAKKDGEKKAFLIMPFKEHLDALYQWEIIPFLKERGYASERADDVNRIGYIMCEKICKKIQEADLIVVDVSFNNPNVFYEMGLSIALHKPLLLMCNPDKYTTDFAGIIEKKYGIPKNYIMKYPFFDKLKCEGNKDLDDYIFNKYEDKSFQTVFLQKMQGLKTAILKTENYGQGNRQKGPKGDQEECEKNFDPYSFEFDFFDFCKSAAGRAMYDVLHADNDWVNSFEPEKDVIKEITPIDLGKDMEHVSKELMDCCCAIIDITNNGGVNYFWLGYIHGISGNVIPINRRKVDEPNTSNLALDSKNQNVNNLKEIAFDIRALWHIIFDESKPLSLSTSLKDILKIIYEEKASNKNRDKFWESILRESAVSIFLGSYHFKDLGRNVIGDWDYRAAAEITSFLTNKKETIKVKLESPLPQRVSSLPDGEDIKDLTAEQKNGYIEELKKLLKTNKNCIIIASPDVNDLTEVALCEIYGKKPFPYVTELTDNEKVCGFIPCKFFSKASNKYVVRKHVFYSRMVGNKKEDERGFLVGDGKHDPEELLEKHTYIGHNNTRDSSMLLGLLVVANNPLAEGGKIISISGLSGPATFGIAQLLTGCIYDEFTVDPLVNLKKNLHPDFEVMKSVAEFMETRMSDLNTPESTVFEIAKKAGGDVTGIVINYNTLSEKIIEKIGTSFEGSNHGCAAIIEVGVYYPERTNDNDKKDDRKIIAFNLKKWKGLAKKITNNIADNPCEIPDCTKTLSSDM
ncbi:hypothetical protein [Candidatus Bathycorpusculum sp.]|uniref:hypothetical protein n=1 Tax=Candidatus Bathycorpusculum sp. TaxID=2994959 RepID=UPI00281FBCFA|nr:hypothetical protein [Candidatus Termitimicrobium sp.]